MTLAPARFQLPEQRMKTLALWLAAVSLPLIWLWTRLIHPTFGMIDDPADLSHFQSMHSDLGRWFRDQGFHGETGDGRIRPVYWLLRYFFYFLPAGFNPAGWMVIHTLNLVLALSIMFLFIRTVAQDGFAALIACGLWVFSVNTVENYGRLATQEVWQVLFLITLFSTSYGILRSSSLRAKYVSIGAWMAALFCLYFVKETSVVLLPISAFVFAGSLILRRNVSLCFFFLFVNAVFFSLQRHLAPPISGYSSHFQLSLELIVQNARRYFFELQWHYLLVCLIASYAARLILRRNHLKTLRVEYWQFIFLLTGLAFFLIILPWTEHVRRYLLPSDFCFALFMALEIKNYLGALTLPSAAFLISALTLASLSTAGLPETLQKIYRPSRGKGAVHALRWFAGKAKPDAQVLVFELEQELIYSTLVYLQRFFKRPDIVIHTFSPFAQEYHDAGYNIYPLQTLSEELMSGLDYILWNRRGIDRTHMEQFHGQMLALIKQSPYGHSLKSIYHDLNDRGDGYPEGVEIWELEHGA